jgi:nucleotide-binding universal stress UspA family protein
MALAACQPPAKLLLLAVNELIADLEEGHVISEKVEQVCEDALAKAAATAKARGLQAQSMLVAGDSAAGEIVRAAEEENVDLIVMGSHGRSGLQRFLLGGTAVKVVANAPCSVMVVKGSKGG